MCLLLPPPTYSILLAISADGRRCRSISKPMEEVHPAVTAVSTTPAAHGDRQQHRLLAHGRSGRAPRRSVQGQTISASVPSGSPHEPRGRAWPTPTQPPPHKPSAAPRRLWPRGGSPLCTAGRGRSAWARRAARSRGAAREPPRRGPGQRSQGSSRIWAPPLLAAPARALPGAGRRSLHRSGPQSKRASGPPEARRRRAQ
mmetsp:Transcript_84868/g.248764  ORF Transcript_84868/g.248764 Transcript_84868/m.248764 type:complete len:200 (-) Transcript_84868:1960-2559(-)